MNTELMREIKAGFARTDLPEFKVGDTIDVGFQIKEGEKTRVQEFVGIVISMKRGPLGGTFTVRKMSFGIGVERIFPLYSPLIDHIKVLKRGKVRRSKLYYLRALRGKKAKVKELQDWQRKDKLKAAKVAKAAKAAEKPAPAPEATEES